MNTPHKLYIFLREQIYNKITELYEASSTNKVKKFEIIKRFDSKGNKINWDDIEQFHYIYEDIEFISCRTIQYSEPDVYGNELKEHVIFDLKELKNIEDLEILEHLKFKLRQAKIQNIIQED